MKDWLLWIGRYGLKLKNWQIYRRVYGEDKIGILDLNKSICVDLSNYIQDLRAIFFFELIDFFLKRNLVRYDRFIDGFYIYFRSILRKGHYLANEIQM